MANLTVCLTSLVKFTYFLTNVLVPLQLQTLLKNISFVYSLQKEDFLTMNIFLLMFLNCLFCITLKVFFFYWKPYSIAAEERNSTRP